MHSSSFNVIPYYFYVIIHFSKDFYIFTLTTTFLLLFVTYVNYYYTTLMTNVNNLYALKVKSSHFIVGAFLGKKPF